MKTRAPVVIENIAVKYDSFSGPQMVEFLPYHWSIFTFTIYIAYSQILSGSVVHRDYSCTYNCVDILRPIQQQTPSRINILQRVKKFNETGSVKKGKITGRPFVLQKAFSRLDSSFERSPKSQQYI